MTRFAFIAIALLTISGGAWADGSGVLSGREVISTVTSTAPQVVHEACFRPHGASCEALIVGRINASRLTVDAEVYNYTLPSVGDALVAASKRGVKVRVIVDKITPSQKGEQASKMLAASIPTFVDCPVKIHHDKVAVIDGETVITGSFNWSANAEHSNAENAVAVYDPALAALFTADFEDQLKSSIPLTNAVCH